MSDDPYSVNLMNQFILIGVLTLINACFAAAEISIISANPIKIKQLADQGDKRAQLLQQLLKQPNQFLSTIQVGITLAGFFSSASASMSISGVLAEYLTKFSIPYAQELSIVVITLILSYITLVFGELFPKRVAMQKSEEIALIAVKPILFVSKITLPFVKLLSGSTNLLIKLCRLKEDASESEVSKEDIQSLIDVGEASGVIHTSEKEMIQNIFDFRQTSVKEIMTPRTSVYCIDLNKPFHTYIDEILTENYSRIPVFKDQIDNIVGILYLKDLMPIIRQNAVESLDITTLMREPLFVHEKKNSYELLADLRAKQTHMAILIDEYGGVSGIVTIEDLIEEITGEIEDEYDILESKVTPVEDKIYAVKGSLTIKELNDALALNLSASSPHYETIGGLMVHLIGHFPHRGQDYHLKHEGLSFAVKGVNEHQIQQVLITVP